MEEKKKIEKLNRELKIENNILKQKLKQEKEDSIKEINEVELERKRLELERNELQDKIDSIIYSRSYKLVQKITNILKRR